MVVRFFHYTVPATGGILVEKNPSIAKSVLIYPHDNSFIIGNEPGCVPCDAESEKSASEEVYKTGSGV